MTLLTRIRQWFCKHKEWEEIDTGLAAPWPYIIIKGATEIERKCCKCGYVNPLKMYKNDMMIIEEYIA